MILKEKLLTSNKKYLYNAINRRFGFKYYNSYCSTYSNCWNDLQTLFRQKKALTERYSLLKDSIFCFLVTNIVSTKEKYYDDLPKLIYDDLKVHCFDLYGEGLKHLKKDIPQYSERINYIKKKVNEFNNNFEFFEKCELDSIVIKYFKDNHLFITNNVQDAPSARNIIIDLLLPELKALWFRNIRFDLQPIGNELKIKGAVITVFSNNEEKTEIENCINNLKQYDCVVHKIRTFKDEAKKILEEGQKLSNEISRDIVTKIDIKEHRTICEDCPRFFSFFTS